MTNKLEINLSENQDNIVGWDSTGKEIYPGDTVHVADPGSDDLWEFEFCGTVVEAHGIYVLVEDGDGDCWDVSSDALTVVED